MPNTTNFAITYPASTDHVRMWEHLQELATDTDLALLGVQNRVTRKIKQADESVTSSITMQNDDDLFVSVVASGQYTFEGVLNFVGDVNADAKFGFTFPTGAELYLHFMCYDTSLANFGSFASHNQASGASNAVGIAGASTYRPTHVRGSLFVAGTAGTFQLQWAQNASNATATVLKKGSLLVVEKVN